MCVAGAGVGGGVAAWINTTSWCEVLQCLLVFSESHENLLIETLEFSKCIFFFNYSNMKLLTQQQNHINLHCVIKSDLYQLKILMLTASANEYFKIIFMSLKIIFFLSFLFQLSNKYYCLTINHTSKQTKQITTKNW